MNHSQPYRWIVLTVFIFVAALTQFFWLNFAPLLSLLETNFHVNESIAGLLLLVFPLIYVLLSIPAGSLIDRKGYPFAITFGAVVMAVFSTLRIVNGSFTLLLIAQVGIAIGQPFVLNGISKLVLDWFSKGQGAIATGLGTMGMFIGMAAGMALTPTVVGSFGFQGAMVLCSACGVLGAIACCFLMKSNPLSKAEDLREVTVRESFSTLMKNKDLLKVFWISFLGLGFFNGLTTWIEPILAPGGMDASQAGNVGGILILGGIIGAVVIPLLSDTFKRRKPFLVWSISFAFIILYPLCMTHSYVYALILGALEGFLFLPAFALLLEICAELAGERLSGSATALLLLFGNAGGVIVIIAMEALKGDGNSFYPGVLLMVLVVLGALVTAVFLPETFQTTKSIASV